MSEGAEDWFGETFQSFHPLIQQLHSQGGRLIGQVDIQVGTGMAGFLGKRIAKKMGIPPVGTYPFLLSVTYQDRNLIWERGFGSGLQLISVFRPVGSVRTGYWLERTEPVDLHFTVEQIEGGWYWRLLRVRYRDIPLPKFIFPRMEAYKRVQDGCYDFKVAFSFPGIGKLVSYGGKLKLSV